MKRLSISLGMIMVLMMAGPSFAIKFTVEPAAPSVSEGHTVALSIYLDDWIEPNNVTVVDYYITYNQDAASIVDVTKADEWDDAYFYDATPVPDSASCGVVNFGAGVAGPKMLLQTVVLLCIDANVDFNFVVKLGNDGIVLDKIGNEYTNVTTATIPINQREPWCGDGFVDGYEQCDDGNTLNGDCCSSVCTAEVGSPCPSDGLYCNGNEFCNVFAECGHSGNPCGAGTVCSEGLDTCITQTFCKGNFDFDKDVDGTDASVFKSNFGRSALQNPCPSDGPAPVERTGQVSSWYTGDDGSTQYGVESPSPRFTITLDHLKVTDNKTGLMWTTAPYDCGGAGCTWEQALSYCNNLALGSNSDWRLPHPLELLSLMNYQYANPAISNAAGTGHCTPSDCPFVIPPIAPNCWTSTTLVDYPDNAHLVVTWQGTTYCDFKTAQAGSTYPYYAWCVSGGHPY